MESEFHQPIEEQMCKFKGKSLMCQYMKKSQSSEVLKFGFAADQSRHIYTSLTCTRERKGTISLGLVMQLYYRLVSEGHQLLCIFFYLLLENGIME